MDKLESINMEKYKAFFRGECTVAELPPVHTSELSNGAALTRSFWRHYLTLQKQMDKNDMSQDDELIVSLIRHYAELKAKYGED